jgi:hypothetical protein
MDKIRKCKLVKQVIEQILTENEITLDEFNGISKDIAEEYVKKAVLKPKEMLKNNNDLDLQRIINMFKNAKPINFDELADEISGE